METVNHNNLPEAVQYLIQRFNALEATIQKPAEVAEIQYLSVPEVQALFKISKQSVFNWINSGHLIRRKKGGRTFFLKSEVEAAASTIKKYQHNNI